MVIYDTLNIISQSKHQTSSSDFNPITPNGITNSPCNPSPCGPFSVCRETKRKHATCLCKDGYIGSPPFCRPDCLLNSDCISSQGCIRQRCQNPCPGFCGLNAKCTVLNHDAICACNDGFEGNPYRFCKKKAVEGNGHLIFIFPTGAEENLIRTSSEKKINDGDLSLRVCNGFFFVPVFVLSNVSEVQNFRGEKFLISFLRFTTKNIIFRMHFQKLTDNHRKNPFSVQISMKIVLSLHK